MKEVITIDKRRGSLEENRKHNLDFLTTISGIAILCVVLIHVHQRYLPVIFGEQIPVYSRLPVIDQLLEHLVMFAVGIFVLIAGFKFELTRTISSFEEYTDFVKKRINRLIRPYFWLTTIFAVGGAILQILNLAHKKEMVTFMGFIKQYISNLLGITPHPTHLWFIPMLIFISFLYPLFRKYIPHHQLRLVFFICLSIIVLQYLNYFPLYYVHFLITYEIGTMFYRKFDNEKERMFNNFSQYFYYLLFMVIFLLRKVNPSPSFDLLYFHLLWIIGPIVYFYIGCKLQKSLLNQSLQWLGTYSWPIYLFHEPYFVTASYALTRKLHLADSYVAIFLSTLLSLWLPFLLYKKLILRSRLHKYIT